MKTIRTSEGRGDSSYLSITNPEGATTPSWSFPAGKFGYLKRRLCIQQFSGCLRLYLIYTVVFKVLFQKAEEYMAPIR